MTVQYIIAMTGVYGCALIICVLALVFGLRARANVKRQKVTSLAAGFSPLDIQRIFIGKTYPRKLTRALIVHWAQMGYIRVEYVDRRHVNLIKIKSPAAHSDKDAVFYDRGTYVRERDLFGFVFRNANSKTVNIYLSLFKSDDLFDLRDKYAVREDEGVYSSTHYRLKIVTFVLSVLSFFFAGIFSGNFLVGIIALFTMCIGMFFLIFILEIPLFFRLLFSSIWIIAGSAMLIVIYSKIYDPALLGITAVAVLFIGTYVLVRFVDYREKNNLSDYSDLVNYRKYLVFSRKKILSRCDYYAALPYIYAFGIKWLVKRKFDKSRSRLPEWFISESGKRGGLL